jgi:hypothetical protein
MKMLAREELRSALPSTGLDQEQGTEVADLPLN